MIQTRSNKWLTKNGYAGYRTSRLTVELVAYLYLLCLTSRKRWNYFRAGDLKTENDSPISEHLDYWNSDHNMLAGPIDRFPACASANFILLASSTSTYTESYRRTTQVRGASSEFNKLTDWGFLSSFFVVGRVIIGALEFGAFIVRVPSHKMNPYSDHRYFTKAPKTHELTTNFLSSMLASRGLFHLFSSGFEVERTVCYAAE